MKFIHFGCWNEYGYKSGPSRENPNLINSGVTFVVDGLVQYIQSNPIDWIVVAGDNYYPQYKPSDETKQKILNVDEFVNGFLALPSKITKYILLGNHDIQDKVIMDIPVPSIKYPNLADDTTQTCKILNLQQNLALSNPDLNYQIFNKPICKVISNTLVIMFDSFLFEAKEYGCYTHLFDGFDKSNPKKNLKKLIKYQIDIIKSEIKSNKQVQNIIFIAHHPICSARHLKDLRLVKQTNEKLIGFFKQLDKKLGNKTIYYLCADTHLYQHGIIRLDSGLIINQYIVGTGGAHQDFYQFGGSREPVHQMELETTYQILESYNKTYGFAEIDITPSINVSDQNLTHDIITCKFIPCEVTFINLSR